MTHRYEAKITVEHEIPQQVLVDIITYAIRAHSLDKSAPILATVKKTVEPTGERAGELRKVNLDELAQDALNKASNAIKLTGLPKVPETKVSIWDLDPSLRKAIDWVRRQMENEKTEQAEQADKGPITKKEEAPVADKHFQEPVAQPGRQHPFDGPEVFDDPAPRRQIGESYPRLSELFADKRNAPEGEGEWQLPSGDDHVGEDK